MVWLAGKNPIPMYTGRRNASGELKLGAMDSVTFGEACALITQVIPD